MRMRSKAYSLCLAACIIAALSLPAWAQQDRSQTKAGDREAVENAEESKPATETPEGEDKPAGEEEKKPPQEDKGGGLFGGMTPFFIIIGVFLLMYIFMGSSRRKQAAKRREMLANVKKGDKVTTIGGICGSVADVREDEIILKVDENSRIHVARWAVRGVGEEAKAEKPEDKNK